MRALTSYVLQRAADRDTRVELTNSPRHLFNARVAVPGPRRSSWGIEWQALSGRTTPAGTQVSPASTVNVTVEAPIARSVTIVGAARNLFDRPLFDPASDEHLSDVIPQNGRTVRFGLRWTLGSGR